MKPIALLLPLLALAACGQDPAPQPTPSAAAAAPVDVTPSLPPPDKDAFAKVFAKACPKAEKVGVADCRAQGMGATSFVCKYGLGDDTYLRHDATISQKDGDYVLDNAAATCAEHDKANG